MPPTLLDELRQRRPFASLAEEAHLNLARTDAVLQEGLDHVLRPHGVSVAQYNVLRILRGASPEGLCRQEIRDRLLTRRPDVTRLLDRMEQLGLIDRRREGDDRRFVTTHITRKGMALLAQLDDQVQQFHRKRLGHVDHGRLRTLVTLLEDVRGAG